MSLDNNGDLNMKGIGVGMPGDQFVVRTMTILEISGFPPKFDYR
jgi:hypothetical protein